MMTEHMPTSVYRDSVDLPVDFDSRLPLPLGQNHMLGLSTSKFASPYTWSPKRKITIVAISCLATIFASFAASSYAPCKDQLGQQWGLSDTAILSGIPLFTVGFALGPMFLAPVSEIKGRKPVFVSTGALFIICTICCAVTKSFAGMLLARFWAGIGSSTYSTLVGGIISDIYRPYERNTAMAIFSGGALFGIGLGPLVCGFIADSTSWTWVFWVQAIVNGVLVTVFIILVPETRETIWLERKAMYLNKWYQHLQESQPTLIEIIAQDDSPRIRTRHVRWYVAGAGSVEDMTQLILTSLLRPGQLLLTEPVVFFFSLWAAFSWSVLYITLAVVPTMFMQVYDFSLSMADATFTSACIGSVLATLVGIYQEQYVSLLPFNARDPSCPEKRLYFSCIESLLLPVGLFIFGWAARDSVHWVVASIGIGIATAGIFSVYLAVFNYLADVYQSYASSALAAQSFCRNAIGGIFPLITNQMFSRLGYGPGSTMLGGIGILLSVGPWVLIFFGPKIRSRSRIAKQLQDDAS